MEPLALYIHWPFCLAKCPYCDFNSHVRERIPQARFRAALRRELAWEAERLGRRRLTSIFFGGGTPSLMEPDTVAALIDDARRLFAAGRRHRDHAGGQSDQRRSRPVRGISRRRGEPRLDRRAEPRPGGAAYARTAAFGCAGDRALETARAVFPRLSFDLIYARPGQTLEAWRAELRQALALAADHLSLYQLTIEPGTKFEAMHRARRDRAAG